METKRNSYCKIVFTILFSITLPVSLYAQPTNRQLRNLEAFTRLYGYVQYFHPSDEAPKDWAMIAIYGSKKMLTIKDDTELVTELKNIFHPIAPAIKIYPNNKPEYFSIRELTPGNPEYYQTVSWQHLGFELPMYKNIYQSIRTNRNTDKNDQPAQELFKKQPAIGEFLQKQITAGISCIVPYVLYENKAGTYPKADTSTTKRLFAAINAGLPKDSDGKLKISGDVLEIRLADIMISWNILKHTFPYWDDVSKPAPEILTEALQKAFLDQTANDFLNTLRIMCAPLNDGHMFIALTNGGDHSNDASVPLILTKAEGKIIVKAVLDSNLNQMISTGDLIDSIDNQPSLSALLSKEEYLSGSAQWKQYKGLVTLLNGPEKTSTDLIINRNGVKKSVKITRTIKGTSYRNGSFQTKPIPAGWIKPHVFYVNLSTDSISDIQYKVALANARSIIFDLRGYPLDDNAFNVVSHLLTKPISPDTFFIPEIIYPDFDQITYQSDPQKIIPLLPHLKAKIYFLTDASAQSASETLLGQVKDFKLATIIGQPTSGTNGNINMIYLPGRYSIGYTGLLTKNNDGSKHHLKGIIPDVIIKPTLKGISSGKDEILEEALRMAK